MPREEGSPQTAEDPVRDQVIQALVEMMPCLTSSVRLRLGPALMAKVSGSDIVHSTIVDILERGSAIDFRGAAPTRAFILLALERKIAEKLRFWRADKRDHSRETVLEADSIGSAADRGPLAHMIEQEHARLLVDCLRKLGTRDAEMIALRHVLGLSQEEVAATLHLTLPAARSALHRARQRLATALTRAGIEPDPA